MWFHCQYPRVGGWRWERWGEHLLEGRWTPNEHIKLGTDTRSVLQYLVSSFAWLVAEDKESFCFCNSRLTNYFQTESTEFDFFYYLNQTISFCFKSTPKKNSRWYFWVFFSLELPQRTRKSSLKYQSGSNYLVEITLFIQCTLADLIFLPLMPLGCRMSSTSLSYVVFFLALTFLKGWDGENATAAFCSANSLINTPGKTRCVHNKCKTIVMVFGLIT